MSSSIGQSFNQDAQGNFDYSSLTPATPAAVSVGVASTTILAANAGRKGLILTNTSIATISLNIVGGSAVLNSGIVLYPGGVWVMDSFTYTVSGINGIASLAASNIAIQELN